MFKNRKNLVSISSLEKIRKQSSKGVLKKFSEFAGKTHELESLFNTVTGLRCVRVNFAKFLRAPVLQNICERLFLKTMFIQIQLYNARHNLLKKRYSQITD